MKWIIARVFTLILLTGISFAAVTPALDPFFKEPTNRTVMLETSDGKKIKALVSHQDATQLKLKPGAQFKLFSIEPARKIWKNRKESVTH